MLSHAGDVLHDTALAASPLGVFLIVLLYVQYIVPVMFLIPALLTSCAYVDSPSSFETCSHCEQPVSD